MRGKYLVKVVRLAVEATVVEVDADDYEQATVASIRIAARQDADAWSRVTEEGEYAVHPLMTIHSEDIEQGSDAGSLYDEHHRFVALFADTSTGEGKALLEPWMAEQSSLLIADVAGDWVEQLGEVQEDSSEEYFEHLAGVSAAPRSSSNVINFAEALARKGLGLPPMKE